MIGYKLCNIGKKYFSMTMKWKTILWDYSFKSIQNNTTIILLFPIPERRVFVTENVVFKGLKNCLQKIFEVSVNHATIIL